MRGWTINEENYTSWSIKYICSFTCPVYLMTCRWVCVPRVYLLPLVAQLLSGKTKVVKMTAAPLRIDGSEDAAQGSIPDVPLALVFKM